MRVILGRMTSSTTGTGKDNQILSDEGLAQSGWQVNYAENPWYSLSLREFRIGGGGVLSSISPGTMTQEGL